MNSSPRAEAVPSSRHRGQSTRFTCFTPQ